MALEPSSSSVSRLHVPTWDAILLRPALITGMVTCIVLSWIALVHVVFPDWQGGYLVVMLVGSTFLTLVSEQLTRQLLTAADKLNVRIAEVALMLVLLRLAVSLQRGANALAIDLQQWVRSPSTLLSGEFLVAGAVLLALWFLAVDIGSALFNLAMLYRGQQNRRDDLEYLSDRFTVGAFFLLMPLGILHLTASDTAGLPQLSYLNWLPMVYLACGLLLFAQARLALLEATWDMTDVPADPQLRHRWSTWGIGLVVLVSLLALLFPALDTTTGFYLLMWISYIMSSIAHILFDIFRLVFFPVWWLLTKIFGEGTTTTARPEPEPLPTPPPPPPGSESGIAAFWMNVRLIVFWGVVLAILLMLLQQYLRNQGAINLWDKIWRSIVELVRSLFERLWRVAHTLELPALLARRRKTNEAKTQIDRGWWRRWYGRTNQERVRRLYLMMVERARRAGLPRTPDQSPYEYAQRLEPHVEEEQAALDGLTQAFVEARYSRREIEEGEVGLARRLLSRVQRALLRPKAEESPTSPPKTPQE